MIGTNVARTKYPIALRLRKVNESICVPESKMTVSARMLLRSVKSAKGNNIPMSHAKNCELATKMMANRIEVHLWIISSGSIDLSDHDA